ncbi:phosphate signaling complex protein PhoU [Acholeplasma laidlawii]|jgi:phosphate transport system protein|uniref:Phosphate-specific transport system accessory protein PhoU n=2 Tax=Acholeplasma laidlawii TaxID=2148 RepID=A9NHR4_ACHLI|nr:phosphate signaling complex protein PhoU [Acholeplasma laidlawii]ABX81894.1 phosphate uptake regulator [Acholeplasma laidlawii PG-8A]NWH10876.1 phosphate signaling complex protein PhoU [Acholeplasma laidlawii]NWH12262.1 phosphate signaling complex protein PhoU [Acholeplasma laidlawii]NWH13648.1 phosphate signaling complex protein PhoU [Acholeplasma laidlawii]NWH15029.1 phosphate signaling complex protein PhoU [Acholeplasma laidlawii]
MSALRASLLKAIEELKGEVVTMADLVLNNINESFLAFKTNNLTKAESLMKADDQVDQLEEDISKAALRVIWKEQPYAQDLRVVTGILKLVTDLERIGDHATDIAEQTIHIGDLKNQRLLPKTTIMSEAAYQMVLNAINAFVKQDIQLARQVIEDDDIVDAQFNDVMASVTEQIKNDSIDSQYAVSVIMVAKYMERVADHAVNLAEWTIFMITGEHKKTPLF